MPSLSHEALIALIREKPEFSAVILRELLAVEVPDFTEARLTEAALNELLPAEYCADAVVLFVDGQPVFGCIFEAQLREDPRKGFTWPVYTVSARARHECPFVLVVITPDTPTAQWAAKPIDLGGAQFWAPFVVGPDGVPIISSVERARKNPELAVLSVLAHGKGDVTTAVSIALAASAALELVPEDLRMLYFAFIESALGDAARKAFEMTAQTDKQFFRWHRGSYEQGREEGREEGRERARAAVIAVLEARGFAVSEAHRARLSACTDLAQLDTWLRKAATATDASSVFD